MTSAVQTRSPAPSLPVRGGLAVPVAPRASVVLVLRVDPLGVAPEFRASSIPPVAFLSPLGAGGATAVYRLTHRSVSDADRTFVRGTAGVLLLSFVPDVTSLATDPAATPPGVVAPAAMHVAGAAVSVGLLASWRTER